jgi:hypothetical protein
MYRRAGMNPFTSVAHLFESSDVRSKMPASVNAPQALQTAKPSAGAASSAKANPLFLNDADFYANRIGDTTAAATLLGDKDGGSTFNLFEDFDMDFGKGDGTPTGPSGSVKFRIVPKGDREGVDETGKPFKVPVWILAKNSGVKSVPFKGGNENAAKYRKMLGTTQSMFSKLKELEEIYNKKTFLNRFSTSNESTVSRGIEGLVLQDLASVFQDAKALGGSSSDRDMALIESMSPQRASTFFGRYKGNELALMNKIRSMAVEKVRSVAMANGMDIVPETQRNANAVDTSKLRAKSVEIK